MSELSLGFEVEMNEVIHTSDKEFYVLPVGLDRQPVCFASEGVFYLTVQG